MGKRTGKQILQFTIAGVILLAVCSYVFAIKKTIEVKASCKTLQQKIDSAYVAPQQIRELSEEMKAYESSFGSQNSIEIDFQTVLLQTIGGFTEENNMEIQKFPTPHVFTKDKLELVTFQCTVSGTYAQHLKLIHLIEKQEFGASLVSVYFETKKNIKTKKLQLYMTMYIQKINEYETI